jgi:hypothetical protein
MGEHLRERDRQKRTPLPLPYLKAAHGPKRSLACSFPWLEEVVMTKIIGRDKVARYGQYAVMGGKVALDEGREEVASYWVERDGEIASRFGDLDYAMVRGRMLSEDRDAPDMGRSGIIDIVDHVGEYTILGAVFDNDLLYWVVDGNGMLTTSPGAWKRAYDWAIANSRLH